MAGFEMLKQSEVSAQELKKIRRAGASSWAKLAAYGVAIAAILTLSAIYAQTTSAIFTDPIMRTVGVGAALVVGASSIVFLVFKNALLKSAEQFRVAVSFMLVEFGALTLGAFHQFGVALGWTFDPFVTELTKLAIVFTLPIVALEWITVLSLDPDARGQRAESASKAELATVERQTRERFRMSDPVIAVREAAALTEVIHEELRRLPTGQREMFMGILRDKHGSEFEGVPLLLDSAPNVIDQTQTVTHRPRPVEVKPAAASRLDEIKQRLSDALHVETQDDEVSMRTMAADGDNEHNIARAREALRQAQAEFSLAQKAEADSRVYDDFGLLERSLDAMRRLKDAQTAVESAAAELERVYNNAPKVEER